MAARPAAGQVDEGDGSLPAGDDKAVASALLLRNPCAEFNGGRCAVEAVGIAVLRMAPVVHNLRRVVEQHG